jgi:hypothetical protein
MMPPEVFSLFIERVDEAVFADAWRAAIKESMPRHFFAQNISPTFDNVIKHGFEKNGFLTGMYKNFSHGVDDQGNIRMIFEHMFGIKWSRILALVFAEHLGGTLGVKVTSKILASTVVLEMPNVTGHKCPRCLQH